MGAKKQPWNAEKFIARFFAFIMPEPNSGCWLWLGALSPCGYGLFGWDRRCHFAHRISYAVHFGAFDRKINVLHKCDVPCCVNPEHLFLGTQADNVADMIQKGRKVSFSCAEHPRAKLTEAQVRSIREDPRSSRPLAKLYGVDKSVILNIRKRKSWKALP